jgi:DNA invertase Pin-like site-specific DNA recombinase
MSRRAVLYVQGYEAPRQVHELRAIVGSAFEVVAVVTASSSRGPFGAKGSSRAAPGHLSEALELIASGGAGTLLSAELGALARGTHELAQLLDWLDDAGGDLVVLDVDLDTASRAGRRCARVVRELARLERERGPDGPPRGRPGLAARAPAVQARIVAMREDGMSLQTISDALNAGRVPTPRGGARWRPSSVQAALGYRRPRPPLPRMPPVPPHHRAPSRRSAGAERPHQGRSP